MPTTTMRSWIYTYGRNATEAIKNAEITPDLLAQHPCCDQPNHEFWTRPNLEFNQSTGKYGPVFYLHLFCRNCGSGFFLRMPPITPGETSAEQVAANILSTAGAVISMFCAEYGGYKPHETETWFYAKRAIR